jgi:hypothetical protein
MNDTFRIIIILLIVISTFILFSYNYNLKKIVSKVKLRNYVKLNKFDIFNLYNFLETKYNNILLPKEIIFNENNKEFICNDLKFLSNNEKKNIKIKFKPFIDNLFISKYRFFDKYGKFEIVENESNNSDVPEIDHLSSDVSDDINFDVNDIINNDIEDNYNSNISNKDIFLENTNNNDTENNTTESIINNVL